MDKKTCAGCSLLCDDIMIHSDGIFIDKVVGACLKGKERFDFITSNNRLTTPMIRKNGQLEKVSWEEAFQRANEILKSSSKPLLYGFSTSTCEAQAKAIKLARKIDGFIDSNSSICQGKVLSMAEELGTSLTTLTEIVNKTDLIVLWGANPVESIPRLLNKMLFSRGKFRMTGREIKTLIIVDPIKTKSFGVMQIRDLALNIEMGKDIELIRALKKIIKSPDDATYEKVAGIDEEDLKRLVLNLVGAENGVIIVGQGALTPHKNYNVLKELMELINELNYNHKKGRMSLIMMGGHFNMAGFDHVALSLTGKNSAIQFKDNEVLESEDTLISKLRNDDLDAALIVGTDPISHMPNDLIKNLMNKPIIAIDIVSTATTKIAEVVLPAAVSGIEASGTAIRLDQVAIEVPKLTNPPNKLRSDEELLDQLIQMIEEE